MTTRQHLNGLRRRGAYIQFLGAGFLVIGGLLAGAQLGWIAASIAIPGFALFVWGLFVGFYGRCLTCGVQIMYRLYGNAFFRIDDFARFCPYCGRSLDEEKPTITPNQALERTVSAD